MATILTAKDIVSNTPSPAPAQKLIKAKEPLTFMDKVTKNLNLGNEFLTAVHKIASNPMIKDNLLKNPAIRERVQTVAKKYNLPLPPLERERAPPNSPAPAPPVPVKKKEGVKEEMKKEPKAEPKVETDTSLIEKDLDERAEVEFNNAITYLETALNLVGDVTISKLIKHMHTFKGTIIKNIKKKLKGEQVNEPEPSK